MNTLATAVLAALVVGIFGGAWVMHRFDIAAQADSLKAQHAADTAEMVRMVAAERAAAAGVEAELVAERDRTAALNGALAALRQNAKSMQERIRHAEFNPPTVSPGCPGHPVGSHEFVQLYNAAASAGSAPGDATSR